jgi:hypothetical protein
MLTSLRRPIETLYFSVDPHHTEMPPACCTCRPFTSKVSAFPEPDVACQFDCDLENRDSIHRRSSDWLHCRAHSPVYRFTDLASCNLYLNISSTPTHSIPRASFDCLSPHLSPTEHSLSAAYSWVAMSLRHGSSNPGPSSRKRRRTSPREFDDSRPTDRSILFPVSSPVPDRTVTIAVSREPS